MIVPYRDENPPHRFAFFTYLFIGVNIGLFTYQILLPPGEREAFTLRYAMIPAVYTRLIIRPWRFDAVTLLSPLTTVFLHGSVMHLLTNMVFLWVFGDNVEDKLGHLRFVLFYLACGLIASLSHYVLSFNSVKPMVGASGAIAGIMGAYLWLFPTARIRCILVFFPFFYFLIPSWVILVYWVFLQVSSAYMNISMGVGGDIAWFAHIGGFIAGITYASKKYQVGSGGRAG